MRHPRKRRSIPGLKICRTCGQIYTPRAGVCPNCHRLNDWTRTVLPTQLHPERSGEAAKPKDAQPPNNPKPLTLDSFPQWLRDFDDATRSDIHRISDLAHKDGIVRQTAKALLALRYREPIPDDVDIATVEKEVMSWFAHNIQPSTQA